MSQFGACADAAIQDKPQLSGPCRLADGAAPGAASAANSAAVDIERLNIRVRRGRRRCDPWAGAVRRGGRRKEGSVEWIAWAVPASGKSAGREARGKSDNFLTCPLAPATVFQNRTARPLALPMGPAGGGIHDSRFARNENDVKPLKTQDAAKWLASHPQRSQQLTVRVRNASFRLAK
jgi:hypothetical protein